MTTTEKVFQEAINWLASEHNFFIELKGDLAKLKNDLTEAKSKRSVKDMKQCFQDFRYLAVSEARFSRREQQVEETLLELSRRKITITGSLGEIEQLHQRLKTEARNLVHDSSLYEGKIRDYLVHLQAAIKDHEIEQARALLMELTELLDHAERWLATLSLDLQRAKEIVAELKEEKDPGLENFARPETRAAIEAIMGNYKMRDVHYFYYPDKKEHLLMGWMRHCGIRIQMSIPKKNLTISFEQPGGTSWDRKKYFITYDILQQRTRGRTFRQFLEVFLPALQEAVGVGRAVGGSDFHLPKAIKEALGE